MTHRNLIFPAYYYKESKYNLTEHINTWGFYAIATNNPSN